MGARGPRDSCVSRSHGADCVGARSGQKHGRLGEDRTSDTGWRDRAQRLDLPAGDVCPALCGRLFCPPEGRVSGRPRISGDPSARVDGILLSGLRHRLHVRLFRRQCHLNADATDRRHSRRRLLLLQRDHLGAHHQRRREPLLAAAFAGYRAAMTDAADVPSRARATLPRGFTDRDASDLAAAEAMIAKIGEVYALYGFEAVETPFVEYTDALGKFLPDQDRPNEGVFSFKDDDEQWLSLRYDLTAPLARYVAENYDRLPKPYRSYRAGWVFRNEKPGPGRFRQFMQFDADTVGAASVAADAEICMMAADCMEALGLNGRYVVKVNNRKVLDGVMEAIGLGGEENAGRRLIVLRAIDKLDRLGAEGVRALLGEGRKDESGDFTKGAGLDLASIERVLAYTGARAADNSATLAALTPAVAGSPIGEAGLAELSEIAALTAAAGGEDRVIVDPSIVRGLEYYTGPVF